MSSTHDVVEIVLDDVRVPVRNLTAEQRIKLFQFYHLAISRHYQISHGGSSFVPWQDLVESRRDNWTLREAGIDTLRTSLRPQDEGYNVRTRIVPLCFQKFFSDHSFSNLSLPSSYHWKKGAKEVFVRLCLTQRGALYLEWYKGEHTSRDVRVDSAEYLIVSTLNEDNEANRRVGLVLEKTPDMLLRFGQRILELLQTDATEREKRAERDRKLLEELSVRGKIFNISLP